MIDIPSNLIPDGCERITPEMLPLVTLTVAEIEKVVGSVAGGVMNVQDIYPLAPLQEGILFHHLMVEQGDPYLLKRVFSFASREHLKRYLDALQAVTDRHDILRTGVVWEGLASPVQVVWRKAALVVEELELNPSDGEIKEQLQARFDPRHYRLDVIQVPLRRLFVAEDRENQRWVMLELSHHLINDHQTLQFVRAEIEAHILGDAQQLAAPVPFRNFVAQARLGVSQDEHEAFFRRMLGEVDEPTAPFGLMDVHGNGQGIDEARQEVEAGLSRRLRRCAWELGVSTASLHHLAWALVLSKVSGCEDVVFGTLMLGRLQGEEGAAQVLGMVINTLPVRIGVGEETTQIGVRKTHETLTRLIHHEHASLALAQHCSGVVAPAPLFTSLLNYRRSGLGVQASAEEQAKAARAWDGIEFLSCEERTTYPFVMSVDDLDEGFVLTAQVEASLDADRICGFMHKALEELVGALESAPETPLHRLDIMSKAERQQILVEWNDTKVAYPQEKCIHELFEEQVERTPDAVAVVLDPNTPGAGEQQLTYRELNERANQLAHHLQKLDVGPDVLVGICVERSLEMIVGLLGILKAGSAYVPLDPSYPKERLAFMLQDSHVSVLLTQERLLDVISQHEHHPICLDRDWPTIAREDTANPAPNALPGNLAYVIYTSGSTGRPKGVQISHQTVVNFLEAMCKQVQISSDDCLLAVTTIGFDIAVLELFLPLIVGAQVVIASRAIAIDGMQLRDALEQWQATVIQATPATWQMILDIGWDGKRNLKILCGGETLSGELAGRLIERSAEVWNLYGPTETTIWSMTYHVNQRLGSTPIGRPIANTQIYILDAHLNPVPVGVPGELHIGGAGLARGYLNRADLTAEKFIPNPFSVERGEQMYRTGDLARWLPDGNIEYLGRIDHQVKVRGFRIELGEIEAVLRQHPVVQACTVLAREDNPGNKQLVAYIVSKPEQTASVSELRSFLKEKLPEYMVPAVFVMLDELPLTPNGKLDRKALPIPSGNRNIVENTYVAPRTATEEKLAQIWNQVLRVERVSIHDNFFELGGDSLLVFRILSNTGQAGLTLTPKQLFEYKTIAKLAAIIDEAQSDGGVLPLTSSQTRLLDANLSTYHIIAGLFEGVWMDPVWVGTVARYLNMYHDELRARFVKIGSTWQQIIAAPNEESSFIHIDLSTLPEEAHKLTIESIVQELQSNFNLAQGNLWRVAFFDLGKDQPCRLFIVVHEIVSDAVSLSILYENFQTAYKQLSAKQDIQLPPKTSIREVDVASEIYVAIAVENRWMNTIGEYCKVYPIQALHAFPSWADTGEIASDATIYLHDNYVVTQGIFKDQQVIFEDVTPEWVTFCHDQLSFKSPAFDQNALVIEKGIVGELLPLITKSDFDTEDVRPWWRMFEAAYEVPGELDASQLKQIVRQLVTQYDGLRLRIVKDETVYRKFIALVDPNVFIEQDISSLSADEQSQSLRDILEQQWISLDFAKGPLLRFVYLDRGPTRPAVLLIVIHHALMDIYSLELFLNDVEDACGQLVRGELMHILPATTTFKTWAERMDAYCRSEAGKRDLDWWLSLPWERVRPSPLDYPENQVIRQTSMVGAIQGHYLYTKEAALWGKLTVEETQALLKIPKIYQVGIMDVLLTALALTFYRWQKVSPLFVVMGDNNRYLFDDLNLTRMIGYLTSYYPILFELSDQDAANQLDALNSIKEQFARLPHHGNLWDWFVQYYTDTIFSHLPTMFNIFFLYNGHTSSLESKGPSSILRPIILPAQEQQSVEPMQPETLQQQTPAPFECIADISDGEFRVRWVYKEGLHTQSTAQTLLQTYLDVLRSFTQGKFL